MIEPIIIETPAPPTRERLVLVPPESVSIVRENGAVIGLSIRANNARDATPADLERAGWARGDDTRAGLRDALRARERAELDALAELDEQRARAEKAERERDEASKALLVAGCGSALEVERDTARAELARLTASQECLVAQAVGMGCDLNVDGSDGSWWEAAEKAVAAVDAWLAASQRLNAARAERVAAVDAYRKPPG